MGEIASSQRTLLAMTCEKLYICNRTILPGESGYKYFERKNSCVYLGGVPTFQRGNQRQQEMKPDAQKNRISGCCQRDRHFICGAGSQSHQAGLSDYLSSGLLVPHAFFLSALRHVLQNGLRV